MVTLSDNCNFRMAYFVAVVPTQNSDILYTSFYSVALSKGIFGKVSYKKSCRQLICPVIDRLLYSYIAREINIDFINIIIFYL